MKDSETTSPFSPKTVLHKRESVMGSETKDGLIMMDLDTGNYFGMGSIESRVWSLLDGTRSIHEICQLLGKEYEVDLDRCSKDVIQFCRELHDQKLVAPKRF